MREKFQIQLNDFRALFSFLNFLLIVSLGIGGAWFGILISLLGLVNDFHTKAFVNSFIIHGTNILLNLYLISLL